MAFAASGLSLVAKGQNFNIWRYTTTDSAATVDTTGYFNSVYQVMNVGDWIISTCNNVNGLHIVASISSGVVDVLDAQIAGTTDTD